MAARRRQSEIIKPLAVPEIHNVHQYRRSSSWTLSESEYFSDDDEPKPLAEQLTNQRWHEVGNGPYPLCASPDFETIVDQLSSILTMRLRELLIYWMNGSKPGGRSSSFSSKKDAMASATKHLKLDSELGDYVLVDSIATSIREYVTCIGSLYNNVGFHSFQHAAHVTISMNKLLAMVIMTTKIRAHMNMERRTSEHNVMAILKGQNSNDFSYGIGDDPRILFAMLFSALIHDVGHTGVPNSVLVDEEDDLAILHNDVSVAEQNSLQVAFSMLQQDRFAGLKRCIFPTPEERKFFRKTVICMVMVTDISDQERLQIVKSRWNAAFPEEEGGGEENMNGSSSPQRSPNMPSNNNGQQRQGGSAVGNDDKSSSKHDNDNHSRLKRHTTVNPRNRENDIRSHEIRESLSRRRYTMFTTNAANEEFAKAQPSRRLGIRTSMDFSGMLLDAYRTLDQLQQHAVLETMMNVADVAHTMQSFPVFVKWNRRLFKEFYVAHLNGRLSFDPTENWYENQIGFFQHYIIPLSQKMRMCGVFGTTGTVFEYFATENKKRWMEEGETISEEIVREVMEEVEGERQKTSTNGCH